MFKEFCNSAVHVTLTTVYIEARNATAQEVQDWYMKRIVDFLPPLEKIFNCDCPRIYIPICATDNRTYTNVCWMNCMNVLHKRKNKDFVQIRNMGMCLQNLLAFEF